MLIWSGLLAKILHMGLRQQMALWSCCQVLGLCPWQGVSRSRCWRPLMHELNLWVNLRLSVYWNLPLRFQIDVRAHIGLAHKFRLASRIHLGIKHRLLLLHQLLLHHLLLYQLLLLYRLMYQLLLLYRLLYGHPQLSRINTMVNVLIVVGVNMK